jgi:NADH-quinone oxidoreductase subunit C
MDAVALAHALTALVPECGAEPIEAIDRPTIVVPASHIVAVATALRDAPELCFSLLVDIVGVDFLPRDPRFELNYHLVSPDRNQPLRLRVKVRVSGDDPHVSTVTGVWPAANFLEREVWDLLGITFDGHPDLRRLLTPDDWEGHPLRKDYPVQVKIPVRTDQPIQITQEEFQANLRNDRHARGGTVA